MKRTLVLALCILALVTVACRVVSSDFTLHSGETISGDLTIQGGHSTLEQGSRVAGDLHVGGGSVDAYGQVDGDVLVTGGSINFGSSAVVRGVLNKTGGGVNITPGATVHSIGPSASPADTVARVFGNLGAAFFGIPLALAIAFVVLMSLRPRRVAAPTVGAAQAVSEPAPPASPLPAAVRGNRGLGTIIFGVILLGVGLLSLLEQALNVDVWHYGWPLFLFLPGVFLLVLMLTRPGDSRLAMPASILMMAGLIFLFQNALERYDTWSYVWALIFPTAIGIGHVLGGWWGNHPDLLQHGKQETIIGLVVFVVLAAFIELVVNRGLLSADLAAIVFPILLIAVGLGLIVSRLLNWPAAQTR